MTTSSEPLSPRLLTYNRAHLSREYRWYKKHKNDPEVKNQYPHDRYLSPLFVDRKLVM